MPFSRWEKRKILAVILLMDLEEEKEKKRRRVWANDWLMQRSNYNSIPPAPLGEGSLDDFKHCLKMSDESFRILVERLRPRLAKQDTVMRKAITAEERLIATLRFLATGRSYEDLKFSCGISSQALGRIVPETCQIIIDELVPEYIKFPTTPEEWQLVAKQFEDMWQFPNCGGAYDGKHVRITTPTQSRSDFYNYKGFFSVVMLALVNAKYEFLMVDVGHNGRTSDGGVLVQTEFFRRMNRKRLNLPPSNSTVAGLNFVFVADETFVLQENLVKPFPMCSLNSERWIFNYRLTRVRRVVENAFGVLSQRFRIFRSAINLVPDKVDQIVLASCVLHNFLLRHDAATYCPPSMVDVEDVNTGLVTQGEWRVEGSGFTDIQPAPPHRETLQAQANRDSYAAYFNGTLFHGRMA